MICFNKKCAHELCNICLKGEYAEACWETCEKRIIDNLNKDYGQSELEVNWLEYI